MILYLVAVVLLGALLAPWAFGLVESVKHVSWLSGILREATFRRVFDRTLLVVAAIGLVPLLRALRVPSWRDIGYVRRRFGAVELVGGVCLGCVSFGVAGALLVLLGGRQLSQNWIHVTRNLITFALTGVLVALVEETFFRGGLQTALGRGLNAAAAIVITSAVYSVVHFMKPSEADIPANAVCWTSGFEHLVTVLRVAFKQSGVGLGFVTLFLAGLTLGIARARTGALYLPIGVHAGWVFTQKTFQWMTDRTKLQAWWGSTDLVEGMLTWPLLLVLIGIVLWLTRQRKTTS